MHWKTLKIMTVVALLASPSALAAIPAQTAVDGAAGRSVTTSDGPPMLQLAHHRHDRFRDRGHRHDRFRDRGQREIRGRYHDRDRHHYHRGRGHRHPHFRHHHRPRHFHGRPIRRLFRHWLRHHY